MLERFSNFIDKTMRVRKGKSFEWGDERKPAEIDDGPTFSNLKELVDHLREEEMKELMKANNIDSPDFREVDNKK